ncbi:hypothetical protein KIPB_014802, partial [Kipferlia bialata]
TEAELFSARDRLLPNPHEKGDQLEIEVEPHMERRKSGEDAHTLDTLSPRVDSETSEAHTLTREGSRSQPMLRTSDLKCNRS